MPVNIFILFGDYLVMVMRNNKFVMIVRKFMIELLKYTHIIADRIRYYNAIVDFTEESHWFNPFYRESPEIMVIWTDDPKEGTSY